jgi:putative aminopeptidase FrvX
MLDTLRKLVESYGPSGHEDQTRQAILAEIDGLADEVSVDALGNVIAWKRCGKKDPTRVMLAAHMDEIGLMVSFVEKNGFLRFANIGYLIPNTLHGNRVRFADGTTGVIGVDREYLLDDLPRQEHLFVDIGGGNGGRIGVGDAAGLARELVVSGSRLIGKSMDDRAGCALQIEVMRRLKKPANDVAFVFTTQEEIGSRGARTSAYSVEPHIGIAIDVTMAGDTPRGMKTDIALGKGPAIKVRDTGMIASPDVVRLMERAAKAARVPYQREVLTTGTTDAAGIQINQAGVRSGALSIPCRYVHTTSEMVDLADLESGVKLLVKLLETPLKF